MYKKTHLLTYIEEKKLNFLKLDLLVIDQELLVDPKDKYFSDNKIHKPILFQLLHNARCWVIDTGKSRIF